MWKYACIQRMLSVTRSFYLCKCVCLLPRLNMGRHPNLACPFFFFHNQENELSGSDKETCLTQALEAAIYEYVFEWGGGHSPLIFQTFLFPSTGRISSYTRPVVPFKEHRAAVCPCVFVSSHMHCICVPSPV